MSLRCRDPILLGEHLFSLAAVGRLFDHTAMVLILASVMVAFPFVRQSRSESILV